MGEGESDEFKRVLLEGNPYFLALTFSVSLLHSVFDFFAFKNDIGFWKNKKSVEGLSVRSIGLNAIMQVGLAAVLACKCVQDVWHAAQQNYLCIVGLYFQQFVSTIQMDSRPLTCLFAQLLICLLAH